MPAPIGRPTKFSKQMAERICSRLKQGETLRAMCRDDDSLPDRSTINDWIATNVIFSDQVARAREVGSHAIIEEARDIADDGSNDYMEKFDKDGASIGYFINGEHVSRSKLRIEQRWREAESILPTRYGKQTNTHLSGAVDINKASSEEIAEEIMALLISGRVKLPGGVEIVEADDEADDPFDVG